MDDFDQGWDTYAELVDDRWVHRRPRRPEVEPWMRRELTLLPWLAPHLPLPVSVPEIVADDPLIVRHELIVGSACDGRLASHGSDIGRFLTALHAIDPDAAVGNGATDRHACEANLRGTLDRFADVVVPRLPAEVRDAGSALLDRMQTGSPDSCLVHADLGSQHIRVSADRVNGIIDWLDARIGDPALDLSWVLNGASPTFADAVLAAYRPSAEVESRALDWYRLGPWHEVLYGLDTGQPDFERSGLAGVIARLRRPSRN